MSHAELVKVAREGCRDEYKDYLVYSELAKFNEGKNDKFSEIFSDLANTEKGIMTSGKNIPLKRSREQVNGEQGS
jgi:hypothetical protein